jgi:hypothetical protein
LKKEACYYLLDALVARIDERLAEKQYATFTAELVGSTSWQKYVDQYLAKFGDRIMHMIRDRCAKGYLSLSIHFEVMHGIGDWAPSPSDDKTLVIYLQRHSDLLLDLFGQHFLALGFQIRFSYSSRILLLSWNHLGTSRQSSPFLK